MIVCMSAFDQNLRHIECVHARSLAFSPLALDTRTCALNNSPFSDALNPAPTLGGLSSRSPPPPSPSDASSADPLATPSAPSAFAAAPHLAHPSILQLSGRGPTCLAGPLKPPLLSRASLQQAGPRAVSLSVIAHHEAGHLREGPSRMVGASASVEYAQGHSVAAIVHRHLRLMQQGSPYYPVGNGRYPPARLATRCHARR